MTTLHVHAPAPVAAPRGADWAAALFARLLQAGETLGQALAESKQRAQRRNQAHALRVYAQRYAGTDPRVVSELLAAAARSEHGE